MKSLKINIKNNLLDALILLPILWAFTGLFLYPNGKKTIVVIILIAAITSLYKYGTHHIKDNLKDNKFLWLLGASSLFAILADSYYGYSASQLRAFISIFVYLSILPPQLHYKIDLKALTVMGSLTSLIYLLMQIIVYNNNGRMWSINPIPYATFITSIAIISLYFLLQSQTFNQRVLWLITFMVTLPPLFHSQARGLWLALSIAIITLAIKSILNNKKSILVLIPLLLGITLSGYLISGKLTQRFEQTKIEVQKITSGNLNTSFGQRLQMWEAALIMSKKSPIIGLGDAHIAYKEALAKENIISPTIVPFTHYHNQFLNALVKYGIIGLLLLLFSIYLPIYYFFTVERRYKWPAILVVLIFMVASLTDVPFQHAQPLTFYFIVMYITLSTASPELLTKREIQ
jgi:O-antigen ligase